MRVPGLCLILTLCSCAPSAEPREVSPPSPWIFAKDVRVDVAEGPRRLTIHGKELVVDRDFNMAITGDVSVEIAGDLPLEAEAEAASLSSGGIELEGHVETRMGESVSP